ncbi:hypothetical protein [Couchioplanes azureus]|uniref:hypothetical protein n=1 Tax=Couchioplanes caeruleus TaxID=56438 RepID=UPI0016712BB0|nr:hypothetical protein [Couchioplanes caeruleus]GGQ56882.1 hypothetical protein GCM10010166_28110 [Couchioplanes caeruleus subsp. azureus]
MEAARFRPTWRQALGRGLYGGVLLSLVALAVAAVAAAVDLVWAGLAPPGWAWLLLAVAPSAAGAVAGLLLRPWMATEIGREGIRTVTPFGAGVQPWSRVVDLRAERRGARTVVSVYLESGASVQLRAPYSGGLFAADPQFESKVFALWHLWRSHRIGGVPS